MFHEIEILAQTLKDAAEKAEAAVAAASQEQKESFAEYRRLVEAGMIPDRDALFSEIARRFHNITTLEERRSSDDYREVSVSSLRASLNAAYEAGLTAAANAKKAPRRRKSAVQ